MNFLLEVTAEDYGKSLSFVDSLGFGAKVLALGMLTVFAVLILIWGSLEVFRVVFTRLKQKESPVTAVETAPVEEALPATDDGELVAVLAAAIAMAESEQAGVPFRVVSFRRK